MQACHARRNLSSYYHVNRAIHDRINAAGHYELLLQVYTNIKLRLQNMRFRSNLNHKKWYTAMSAHLEIADALASIPGTRTALHLRQHLQRQEATVLENTKTTDTTT